MKFNWKRKSYKIYNMDCLEFCNLCEDNTMDSVITDPPYGLNFMGKDWDHGVPSVRFWKEFLRVSKPGAILMAFGGTRTFHRLACAIEDAGWQIRDTMMWVYGSGFPKSHTISKAIDKAAGAEREVVGTNPNRAGRTTNITGGSYGKPHLDENEGSSVSVPATSLAQLWDGWGTALKPAWEPIIVAMKPLDGTFAANAEKWGVAGLCIDGCRVEAGEDHQKNCNRSGGKRKGFMVSELKAEAHTLGRFPANLIHDGSDEVVGLFPDVHGAGSKRKGGEAKQDQAGGLFGVGQHDGNGMRFGDSGSASRFFYCAKASKVERTMGTKVVNKHPTVKPKALLKYLLRLTSTPTGGVVFDPFMGSGSMGLAALMEGRKYIGTENDVDSGCFQTAKKRLAIIQSECVDKDK